MRFEEALKNYLKTSEWKYQKAIDQGFDKHLKDPVTAREEFDQLSGIGTNNLGLAGIIRNPAKSFVDFNPKEQFNLILDKLKSYNGEVGLSEKSLPFLARNLVKYTSDIGTEKDPIYELIKRGVYNEDNVGKLSFANPEEIGFGEITPHKDYDKLKEMFLKSSDPNVATNKIRKAQELPNRYYNTEPEKRALEEYYDRSLRKSGAIRPNSDVIGDTGYSKKFGYLDPERAHDIKVIDDSYLLENPFGHIFDLTWKVKDAIDGGFLTESSLKNNRIGFKDFVTKLEDFSKAENQPGYSKWKSTEPFLEVGPYSWHKLPYSEEAQLVEGLKMGNCAGKYCIAKPGEKDIYSLRRTETNTPKVNFVHLPATNEVERLGGGEHIKGLSNSTPKRKYFDAIEQLKQYLGIK